jgi:hypothetical protein
MEELIQPGEWLTFSFTAPRISRRVQIDIDADAAVDVWAMPAEELESFSEDEDFDYYAKLRRTIGGTLRFKPDGGKEWVLVLDNRYSHPVSVSYDVSW